MTHDELLASVTRLEFYGREGYTPAAFAALRAVVELHQPIQGNTLVLCRACMDSRPMDAPVIVYPCPTIQAIDKALS